MKTIISGYASFNQKDGTFYGFRKQLSDLVAFSADKPTAKIVPAYVSFDTDEQLSVIALASASD